MKNANAINSIPATACTRRISCTCTGCDAVRGLMLFVSDASYEAETPYRERKTAHGAVMSPRMWRFHALLDARKIPIGDWSTDTQVKACLPKLAALRDELAARLGDASLVQACRDGLEELHRDVAGLMQRVPENRSDTVQGALGGGAVQQAVLPVLPVAQGSDELLMVDLPAEQTGAVVYWSPGGAVDAATLRQALTTAGVAERALPAAPSAEVAFTRACKELAARDIMVRKHPKGGYYLAIERVENGEPVVHVGAHFKLDRTTGAVGVVDAQAREAHQVQSVVAEMTTQMAQLAANDISTWLVDTVKRLGGLTLRQEGGFYFVPRQSIPALRSIKETCDAFTGHSIKLIATLRASEGIAAVLDAVGTEVDAWIKDAEEMLADADKGARAAATRIKAADELTRKVTSYEQLLGQPLAGVQARITDVRKRLAAKTTRTANLEID